MANSSPHLHISETNQGKGPSHYYYIYIAGFLQPLLASADLGGFAADDVSIVESRSAKRLP